MAIDWKALAAPFDPAKVHWRVGSTTKDKSRGMALAYLDARDVQDRLDTVVGPENWSSKVRREGDAWVCTLSIRDGEHGCQREDASDESDIEAIKGGASGAFKRAAVGFGIGRYLYRLDSPWVELSNGKYIAKSELPRLADVLGNHSMAGSDVWDAESAPKPPEPQQAPSPPSEPERPAESGSEMFTAFEVWGKQIPYAKDLDELKKWGLEIKEAGLKGEVSDGDAERLRIMYQKRWKELSDE